MPATPARTSRRPRGLARRWAQADADARTALITDAALRLLDRRGLDAVTMRRVAADLGVGTMTLYTYVDGQSALRRRMVERGFALLDASCRSASTVDQTGDWSGGARAYLRFASEHPNLYALMFQVPLGGDEHDLLEGGFRPLLDRVRDRLARRGVRGAALDRQARAAAGRYWIALHGLATLANAGRLAVLQGDLDTLLQDLLRHVAPD